MIEELESCGNCEGFIVQKINEIIEALNEIERVEEMRNITYERNKID